MATGSYEDRNSGQMKNRYHNIGALMESTNDRGETNTFILLDRHFNPAGVPFKQGSDQILISAFDPKPREDNRGGNDGRGQQDNRGQGPQTGGYGGGYDDRGGYQNRDDEIGF
ncbi:hypothetical protein [Gemmobacter sp. 24YEA27]|uniref:hypothetical protein n=1 Tax=Gemmobacter sp. 24YEA27 TaxID=3040672 RepID=UPI0024B34A58|nr:hypothetical protein [Gemmobacter sp. 24YEA27]